MARQPVAALAAAIVFAAACHKTQDASSITAAGHVEATDVRLSAKVPGRLAVFAEQEGAVVAQGQELQAQADSAAAARSRACSAGTAASGTWFR